MEFLNRGKDIIAGNWIYGSFNMQRRTKHLNRVLVAIFTKSGVQSVWLDTVGIHSTFDDINNDKIFTGDWIVQTCLKSKISPVREVIFKDGGFKLKKAANESGDSIVLCKEYIDVMQPTIIGNITDNPRLLEGYE